MLDKLRAVANRFEELCAKSEQADFYADPKKAAALLREKNDLEPIVETFHAYEATLQEEKRVLVVDIGGGTTDCSLLLMGPQWRSRLDREASLLGHSGCRIGGNDLDIALAFKNLMPLLGMGG